ncbi:glycosyltransferase family 4 protein [Patescibacteria group bacterium]|nr:glycosyltransferase family 4 protein [Patescibacteria group bacterium]
MITYGIDANVLTRPERTGTERYVFSLLKEMMKFPLQQDERVLLYVSRPINDLPSLPTGWKLDLLNWPPKRAWTHLRLSWELLRRTPNVFFTPAHEIPRFHGRTKIVSTVHDIAFHVIKDIYPPAIKRRQEWAVRRAIRASTHLLTVSESTKQDLIKYYKVPTQMITATPLAIDREMFEITEEERASVLLRHRLAKGRYFISVGRIEKKKNILMLIDAFTEVKRRRNIGDPIQLVLGGTFGYGGEAIKKHIARSAFKESIRLLGFIPDEDLAALVSGALGYVFPSHYEGFGIPALEAMAARVPLIASDIPALREVAGDAALYASPKSSSQWVDMMERVILKKVDTESMVLKGKERVALFSWEKTAQKTWEVLRSLK